MHTSEDTSQRSMFRQRFCRRALGALIVVATLSEATDAGAQLHVDVPEECGTKESFTLELERLLGPRAGEVQPVSLFITRSDASDRYQLKIQLGDEVREVWDADCSALFRSAIVIAAASVRPELAAGIDTETPDLTEAANAPSPTVAPEATDGSISDASNSHSATESDAPSHRASIGVGVGAALGVLPGLSPLFELGGMFEVGAWGVLGALRYLPPAEKRAGSGRGVEVWAVGGRMAVLAEPAHFLRLSGGIEVQRLEGRGLGIPEPLTDAIWFVAPSVDVTVIPLRAGGISLEVGLQGHWAPMRPRFEIEGFGEVYIMPRVGAVGVARAVWSFL